MRLLLGLALVILATVAHAQPLVVHYGTVPKLTGAFGYVHTATGILPEPSQEPLETLLARAERGEFRLAVVGEPLKGLPKVRPLRLIGHGIANASAVTSPSTRTLGLVTAADLVGEGRPVEVVAGGLRQMRYFGARLEGIEAAKVPLLAFWGGFAGLALFVGMAALRWSRYNTLARGLVCAAAAQTVALLPAALAPSAELAYGVFAAAAVGIAAGMGARAVRERKSAVVPMLGLLVVVVVLDTLLRGGMVAGSVLSGYYGSGIRFYGVGNEYMGMLIGAALMSVPQRFLGGVGAGLTLLLGLPMLGANAGGAMAAVVAFFPPSKKLWGRALLPFGVAFFLGFLDRLMPGAVQSHIGQAAGKGPSAWGTIILRKLAMNARLTVAGPTLAGIGAVGLGVWQLERLKDRLTPRLCARVGQAFWGAGAAIAFNDSGTVAALLLLAPVVVTVIEQALCDFSESTSAPSVSALPSPMSSASEPTP